MRAMSKDKPLRVFAFLSALTTGVLVSGTVLPAIAQVTSDGTTNTLVNANGNNFTILNGIERGNNLFHSFSNFSIPTGGSASFDLLNTPNITTIFSRVTGGNVSDINGLIQTLNGNNPVSLFLMNPAGIVFGENASLNIGGSFVGTTAESILFQDGVEFSAVNASGTPLLTMNVPVGLQMGQNPGAIQVQGRGHTLSYLLTGNTFSPISPVSRTVVNSGLKVNPDNTLSLIGGNVNLQGGMLTAQGGRIEIGSVEGGEVNLDPNNGWTASYENVTALRDINLLGKSLVDVSDNVFTRAPGGGSIQLTGGNVSLHDGSVALNQTLGTVSGGGIKVNASESLNLTGLDSTTRIASQLSTETLGTGSSGSITVSTHQLTMDSGRITARSFSGASGGNIAVNASEAISLKSDAPQTISFIMAQTSLSGAAGEVTVSTPKLSVFDGSVVLSTTFGSGNGGNVTVNAADIELIGLQPITFAQSSLSTVTMGAGKSGNLTVNTARLLVKDGGRVDASTVATGKGGSVTVNASEFIEVTGNVPGSPNPSQIIAGADIVVPVLQRSLGLPPIPSGDSGDVIINTPQLKVINQGLVTVRNEGTGNAGHLKVNADSIFFDNQGGISASTESGEGGNITLNLQKLLLLRNQSQISAEAGGIGNTGNGGNITINSPIIAGLENSDIIANAVQGNGGNINITTQGIFGLELRDRLTSESDITASSEFGISGTVEINNFGIDPSSGLVELPVALADSSQQIASSCSQTAGSSFIVTGRGGMRQNPTEKVIASRPWHDIRDLSAYGQQKVDVAQVTHILPQPAIIEASGWVRNAKGEVELVAQAPASLPQQATCSAANGFYPPRN
ncbi:MAG: S-layer family protein [Nostocaceae cyanobacterium]|nr:S-layer family protein [Nostocaceae cyanobacterium]